MKTEKKPSAEKMRGGAFFCTQNAHKAHTKNFAICYNLIMKTYFTAERRLMSAGLPLDEAITICQAMRREGGLPEFVAALEERSKSE